MMKNPIDPEKQDAYNIVKKIHLIWEHSSAARLKHIFVGAGDVSAAALEAAGEVVKQCDVRTAVDEAPRLRTVRPAAVSADGEEAGVGLLLLDDVIALCAMDLRSTYSLPARVFPGIPPEV